MTILVANKAVEKVRAGDVEPLRWGNCNGIVTLIWPVIDRQLTEDGKRVRLTFDAYPHTAKGKKVAISEGADPNAPGSTIEYDLDTWLYFVRLAPTN